MCPPMPTRSGENPSVQNKKRTKNLVTSDRSGQIHPGLVVGLFLVLGLLLWSNRDGGTEGSPYPIVTYLQETIYVTALALDAEFTDTGAYPPDLETIGMDEEGLAYSRVAEGYTLVASEGEVTVAYESGENLEPFRQAFEALLPPYEEGK